MLILSRSDWKAAYRQLRIDAKPRFQRSNFAGSTMSLIHGSTYWTARIEVQGSRLSLDVYPSIIRDRAPLARIGHELSWSAYYRREARKFRAYGVGYVGAYQNAIKGARMCLADARSIRLNASAFHAIA